MALTDAAKKKIVEVIYWAMLIGGAITLYSLRGSFTRNLLLSSFGIAAALTASYLWIRLDWWRSDTTVKEIAGGGDTAARDLISKRTDSQVALTLLILVAVTQAFLTQYQLALGMLLVLVPVGNAIARLMENKQLSKFKK